MADTNKKADALEDELEAFQDAMDFEAENRTRALEALRFNRLGEQWPDGVKRDRELQGRPMLTLNHMPSFIRQVVNDARQNKPQIVIKPVDQKGDRFVANVYKGLIKNIETQSKADIAYDTAIDFTASCGIGYMRIAVEYEDDDSFDMGLRIVPVYNPFSVYGDPNGKSADGSDWNKAFITELLTKHEFEDKYKGAEAVDWSGIGYGTMDAPWLAEEHVMVAESWTREQTRRKIVLLSDGTVMGLDEYKANKDLFDAMGLQVQGQRDTKSHKVTQRIMSGAEILEENDWAGRYIPIVPVYGEEVNIEGKRTFFSVTSHAFDAQRMFNYWKTTSTELVALAPRVPFIGEEGAFDVDPEKWATANTTAHSYLEVARGKQLPQRQPLDSGSAAGAMEQAMTANDEMKSLIGLHDASLGQQGNETAGVAISARKHEGDVSTFHFIDNMNRSIRQLGIILVDMIPSVYGERQILRIVGDDGKEVDVKQGAAPQGQPPEPPAMPDQSALAGVGDPSAPHPETGMAHVYDLSVGKYDVVVDSGPSFTTRREQISAEMTEFLRNFPQAAPLVGDLFVQTLDWPNAEEIAARIRSMMPAQAQGGLPPSVQSMIDQGKQHIDDLQKQIDKLTAENQAMKADGTHEMQTAAINSYKAETDRLAVLAPLLPPVTLQALGLQAANQAATQGSPLEQPGEFVGKQLTPADMAPPAAPQPSPQPQMPPQGAQMPPAM